MGPNKKYINSGHQFYNIAKLNLNIKKYSVFQDFRYLTIHHFQTINESDQWSCHFKHVEIYNSIFLILTTRYGSLISLRSSNNDTYILYHNPEDPTESNWERRLCPAIFVGHFHYPQLVLGQRNLLIWKASTLPPKEFQMNILASGAPMNSFRSKTYNFQN